MARTDEALALAKRQEVKKLMDQPVEGKALIRDLRRLTRDVLYSPVSNYILNYKDNFVYSTAVPGHIWTAEKSQVGPCRADVMVVNKITYPEDLEVEDDDQPVGAMMGDSSIRLYNYLCDYDMDPSQWYVTNFIKTQHPEWRDGKTTVTAGMVREFKYFLSQEIHLVQPRVILCLGAEAIKAVLGQQITITAAQGRRFKMSYQFPRWTKDGRLLASPLRDVVVLAIPHPHSMMRTGDHKSMEGLRTHVKSLSKTMRSIFSGEGEDVFVEDTPEEGLDHRIIWSLDEYEALADEIDRECEDNLISIDAEWNGSHPQNGNAYLRCFQISWKHKTAATIPLADATEDCEFRKPYYYQGADKKRLVDITHRIFKGRRATGHFIEADLEYLVHFGLDLRRYFSVPADYEKYRDKWLSGQPCGFDTGRAAHAVTETADFSLKIQTLHHTEAGKYDRELDQWVSDNATESSKAPGSRSKKKRLDGYGIIPDEVLYKYAGYDADVTRRLTLAYEKKLGCDQNGMDSWEPYWIAMRALPAILEINCTGMCVNRERIQELTETFERKSIQLLEEIREWARWPELNPRSPVQMREFLFGAKYNGKKVSQAEMNSLAEGEVMPEHPRVRPRGAKSLELPPVLTTGKYPKSWDKIVREHREHLSTPSTNKKVLAQLIHFHSKKKKVMPDGKVRTVNLENILTKLRDYNVVSQALKYVLRPPRKDEETGAIYKQPEVHSDREGDPNGFVYESGIPSFICDDGRIRTHIYPTKATGRWSAARPSMQNLGKNIEQVLKAVFKEDYRYPLRSIICASPGHVLIEGDYTGAEIAGAAYMCNDPLLLEHVKRNQLPEDDPEYFDIHSSVAINAFRLNCPPSKAGLKSIGKLYLRGVAKAVIFGIFYGRGAMAIAEGSKEEGLLITVDEAQQMINGLYETYPNLLSYFTECENRVYDPTWVRNAFGRYRRFYKVNRGPQGGAFERQCKNFPIQSLVADAVNRAVDHLYCLRNKMKLQSRIVLSVHDAVLMEVPYHEINIVREELLPIAMSKKVPIWSTRLDGTRRSGVEPRYFGADIEVFLEWGKALSEEEVSTFVE